MKKILMVMMVCLMSLGFVGCNDEQITREDVNLQLKKEISQSLGVDGLISFTSNLEAVMNYREIIVDESYKIGNTNLKTKARDMLVGLDHIYSNDEILETISVATKLVGFHKEKTVLNEDELKGYVDGLNKDIKNMSSYFKSNKQIYNYMEIDFDEYKEYYYYINE